MGAGREQCAETHDSPGHRLVGRGYISQGRSHDAGEEGAEGKTGKAILNHKRGWQAVGRHCSVPALAAFGDQPRQRQASDRGPGELQLWLEPRQHWREREAEEGLARPQGGRAGSLSEQGPRPSQFKTVNG